jgi:hypothetical protein
LLTKMRHDPSAATSSVAGRPRSPSNQLDRVGCASRPTYLPTRRDGMTLGCSRAFATAFFSARFCFKVLPDFLLLDWRGDLSTTAGSSGSRDGAPRPVAHLQVRTEPALIGRDTNCPRPASPSQRVTIEDPAMACSKFRPTQRRAAACASVVDVAEVGAGRLNRRARPCCIDRCRDLRSGIMPNRLNYTGRRSYGDRRRL